MVGITKCPYCDRTGLNGKPCSPWCVQKKEEKEKIDKLILIYQELQEQQCLNDKGKKFVNDKIEELKNEIQSIFDNIEDKRRKQEIAKSLELINNCATE